MAILSLRRRSGMPLPFTSATQITLTITGSPQNLALPDVAVTVPSGATIVKVEPLLKVATIEDSSGSANSLSGAQNIQVKKSTEDWADAVTAIALVSGQLATPLSTERAGDLLIGGDIKAKVDATATYNFRLASGVAAGGDLVLKDLQVVLRMYLQLSG